MKPFWLYMIECADGSYYVGHTDDLERRLAQHASGELPGYTRERLPVKLVYSAEMPSRAEALERELQLKGWSRAKKAALVRRSWAELKSLARGRDWPERKQRR